MFDRLAWRRECYERYLLLDDGEDELDDREEAAYWADAEDPSRIDDYDTARDYPAVKGPSYLGAHLRFGTVSVRALAREAAARPAVLNRWFGVSRSCGLLPACR